VRLHHIVRSRLRSLFLRSRREADLAEELQLHLDREVERLRAGGASEADARLQARRLFGGIESIKDACRDARGTGGLDALRRDVRLGTRRLARDWRFTVAAVGILGLGIGANTAGFSVINATRFRPSPAAAPDRLVDIYQSGSNPDGVDANSYPAYLDMAARDDVFQATTAVLVPTGVTYLHEGALRSAVVEHTTASYPAVLGLRLSQGRWFTDAEDARGAAVVAVVNHRTWTERFHADPSIIGRTVRMDGVPVTIVGVGPAGYTATLDVGLVTDFWLPIRPMFVASPMLERRPPEAAFLVKARLRDGVTVGQARAAMRILGTRLAAEYPKEDPGQGITVIASSDVRVHPQLDGVVAGFAVTLLAVVGLVLAIACSNLATLLLVRGAARAKEVSVRLALGASRGQLVRHLMVESLLLSVAGGVAGCVLAWWTLRLVRTLDLPVGVAVGLDYRVLAFTIALSLATGLAFGLVPAIQSTKVDLLSAIRGDGELRSTDGRWLTFKNAFVVLQVAVSVLLLGGTSTFLQMIAASRAQRVGFAVDGVAMLQTDPRYAGHAPAQTLTTMEEVRRRIAGTPGVEAAALSRGLPMQVTGTRLMPEGASSERPIGAGRLWAGPGFFDTLRIPILYGRALDARDGPGTPRVAVINETMARQVFGQANAVGRRFRFEQTTEWVDVVGVARDTGTASLGGDLVDPTRFLIYQPFAQADLSPDTVIARSALDPAALAATMQRELAIVDAALPAVEATTMAQYLESSLTSVKAAATLLGSLGALGLALAGIGLYAVVAFRVARRAREIGLRMALGARRPQVVWAVTREIAGLIAVGTAAGLLLSALGIVALRAVSSPAPGITLYRPSVDPVALAAIVGFMAAVGLAAAAMPTWRATRLDPLKALRRD
jgi:predicted permease